MSILSGLKNVAKSSIIGSGIDSIKDTVEPLFGLDPNYRGTLGDQYQAYHRARLAPGPGTGTGGAPGQANDTATYGGGGGGSADPYAQYGGTAAYNQLRQGFQAQKGNIYGTANDAASNAGIGLRGSILDFVDSLRSGQRAVDNKAVQNELSRRQGQAGVMGMVGRGIQSGGVQLANKNATNSSASGALAKAYGDIGRRELTSVGNQYELGQRDVGLAQEDLEQQRASGIRRIGDSKEQIVNGIVAEARNSLAALDSQIAGASLPDRIAIEQEKQAVRDQVVGQLSQYDQLLANEAGGVRASSTEDRRGEAARLANLGTAAEDAFSYTDAVPAEFQNTGPFASNLPIFTYRGRREA